MGDYDYKSIRDKQIGRELVFKIGVYTVAAIVAVPCVLTGNAPGALLSFSVASYVCGSASVTGAITGTNPISGRTITSEERWVEGISGGVQVLSGAYGVYSYGPQAISNILNTPSPPIRSVADIVDDVNSGAGEAKTIPQQLAREGQVPTIGKMKDLNVPSNVTNGEFKVADYLPDMGTPKANWNQNSGILRSVINENVPIKDVSMFPMDNAGFLGAERNLLQSRGWTYLNGYWHPPK